MSWPQVYNSLAKAFQWTADEVDRHTWEEVSWYLHDGNPPAAPDDLPGGDPPYTHTSDPVEVDRIWRRRNMSDAQYARFSALSWDEQACIAKLDDDEYAVWSSSVLGDP